jgi:hypothetical protein
MYSSLKTGAVPPVKLRIPAFAQKMKVLFEG